MRRLALATTAALILSGCSMADSDPPRSAAAFDVPDVAAGDVSVQTMKEVVKTLSSDAFEGRAPGTPGEEKTVAYLIEQFEKAGLEPGNNGDWVQKVPLVEIKGKDFGPLEVTGKDGKAMTFSFGDQWVGVTYREQDETKLDDSELVFVGYGINAPEKGWNDYAGLDMNGKTAVILVNDPDYEQEGLEGTFNGRAMTYYGRWTYKYEEAARQGAAGAIIIHDTFPAAYGWNVVEFELVRPAGLPATQGWRRRSDHGQRLGSEAGRREDPRRRGQGSRRAFGRGQEEGLQGSPARPDRLDAIRQFDPPVRVRRTSWACCPGTARPDEYVLYSAHWDHLGRCKPDATGDDICNGAIDNATGTAALVALAEAQAKAGAADRSLVFLAVTAKNRACSVPIITPPTRSFRWRRRSAGSIWTRSRSPVRRRT